MATSQLRRIAGTLEKLILFDPNNRGVQHLVVKDDLHKSILALTSAKRIALTTGFPCFPEDKQKGETDGLPGALAIIQAVTLLGCTVNFITDDRDYKLTKDTVQKARMLGMLTGPQFERVHVHGYTQIKESFNPLDYESFVAIEKSGRSTDGRYYTMKGVHVTPHCDAIDDLFDKATKTASCKTIGIGDGGNELGLGKVYEQTKKYVTLGEKIGAKVSSDMVVVCGVSNWGGYCIAAGLYVATKTMNLMSPEELDGVKIEQFLPTSEQVNVCYSVSVPLLPHTGDSGYVQRYKWSCTYRLHAWIYTHICPCTCLILSCTWYSS